MAYADPQTVTINAIANTLARVSSEKNAGAFAKDDGLVRLSVLHSYGKTNTRHILRLDHSKIAADPLMAGVNVKATASVYTVVQVPLVGYTVAEMKQVTDGYFAYCTASSGARITQLLGGEN